MPLTGEAAACLDIVGDILARLVMLRVPLDGAVLARLELDVRRDWGGERPYIAKHGEGRVEFTLRDERIRTEHRRGESVQLLARRHGISVRRVQQIVKRVAESA